MTVKIEKIEYKGWQNCYRVANGAIELIVTGDVGPRILRCGFAGGQNLFKEFSEQMGKSNESDFQPRGGHRLWKAPEDFATTWAADNVPIEVRLTASGLTALSPVEPASGLRKEIEVAMASSTSEVTVTHRITNCSPHELTFAPWALTMMATGGVAICAFPPRTAYPGNLLPTNPLVMWGYTDLSDTRFTLTRKYLVLRQEVNKSNPQKVGLFNENTWASYLLNGELFTKYAKSFRSAIYPDYGCSFETFTNHEFLELETLGPVRVVPPGRSVEHIERWSLHRGVRLTAFTDDAIDRQLLPLVRANADVE